MVIVGSGAIGIEFAYFYNSIGTKVTVVEFMENVVPLEDEDISKQLGRSLKKQGINIMTSSVVESVDTSGNGCKVNVKNTKWRYFDIRVRRCTLGCRHVDQH